jgi:shikimate kinase
MVGMPGSGKSAVGSALARRLGVDFRDSDEEIQKAANMTIAEIFERYGESFFREKEAQVIARLLAGPPAVLSTGAGAFLQPANRKAISESGVSLWLDADLDLLWNRVRHKDTRPLLRTADPRGTLAQLYEIRVPHYAEADISVKSVPGLSVEEMTDRVVAALAARPDVLDPEI